MVQCTFCGALTPYPRMAGGRVYCRACSESLESFDPFEVAVYLEED